VPLNNHHLCIQNKLVHTSVLKSKARLCHSLKIKKLGFLLQVKEKNVPAEWIYPTYQLICVYAEAKIPLEFNYIFEYCSFVCIKYGMYLTCKDAFSFVETKSKSASSHTILVKKF